MRSIAGPALVAAVASGLVLQAACFSVLPALRPAAHAANPALRSGRSSRVSSRRFLPAMNAGDEEGGVTLPPMPKFFSKWDDPNYDPTKDEVDTDVPLQIAAFEGDVEKMKKLAAEGADINEPNSRGWTALMYACRYRREEAAKWLLDNGANATFSNSFGATALMQSAHYGGPTKLLLDYVPEEKIKEYVEQRNVFQWTAMHWAGKAGHAQSARELVAAGADVEAKNMKGVTPLLEAATGQFEKNGNQDIVPTLIELGADVNAMSSEGDTPLHSSSYLGFTFSMDLLLKAGADPNIVNKAGQTPVYNAARGGDAEAIELLLKNGGNPNIAEAEGRYPVHEASRWGNSEVLEKLIEAGADVNVKDKNGSTPLHESALWGRAWDDADVTIALIEAGANRDAKNAEGKTAMEIALEKMDEEDVEDSELIAALKA